MMRRRLAILVALSVSVAPLMAPHIGGPTIGGGGGGGGGSNVATGTSTPVGSAACARVGDYFQRTDTAPDELWQCTAIGTPGTWEQVAKSASLLSASEVILRDGTQGPTADIPFGNFKAQMNPTCANYAFTAGTTGSLGTVSLYGHLLKVYLSSGAGNVITVNGCTSFTGTASGTVNTCSCDLAGGGDTCVPLDGTTGSAGFIVESPQNITITLVSSATNGSVDVCQF